MHHIIMVWGWEARSRPGYKSSSWALSWVDGGAGGRKGAAGLEARAEAGVSGMAGHPEQKDRT